MTVEAAMKYLGELDGKKCYWAAPDTFTTPGFYYWDGESNIHVPLPSPKVVLSKRPTIAELEAILDSHGSGVEIEILPNGEVRAMEREIVEDDQLGNVAEWEMSRALHADSFQYPVDKSKEWTKLIEGPNWLQAESYKRMARKCHEALKARGLKIINEIEGE